ncbi:MAG: hypothetical protein PHF33_00190 [Candidatus Delongbacteria bacterium]|nr:hypothetical protein [Candidatus Delongbacteria bacterium]MDD4205349.1 hypothetical protein [Candidatus Delongbacteria bacterium]
MDKNQLREFESSRITCVIHSKLSGLVTEKLFSSGVESIFIESARCARQRILPRIFSFPGKKIEINDSPAEVLSVSVPKENRQSILNLIIKSAELKTPGRGSVYAQDIKEVSTNELQNLTAPEGEDVTILKDLSFINAILSKKGDGEKLAALSLKLGAGVPVLTIGMGTSIRDRLGLIRITIPPEKELIGLVVASHDAPILERLLIDEGHIDRPGGGFIYRTPVYGGVLDPMIRIGRQVKAASMEQIIAALDDLKKGTSWRKRFEGEAYRLESNLSSTPVFSEISFICPGDSSDPILKAVTEEGASGVTISYLRCLTGETKDTVSPARVRGVLCVPQVMESGMTEIITDTALKLDIPITVQKIPAFGVFSHKRYIKP